MGCVLVGCVLVGCFLVGSLVSSSVSFSDSFGDCLRGDFFFSVGSLFSFFKKFSALGGGSLTFTSIAGGGGDLDCGGTNRGFMRVVPALSLVLDESLSSLLRRLPLGGGAGKPRMVRFGMTLIDAVGFPSGFACARAAAAARAAGALGMVGNSAGASRWITLAAS